MDVDQNGESGNREVLKRKEKEKDVAVKKRKVESERGIAEAA